MGELLGTVLSQRMCTGAEVGLIFLPLLHATIRTYTQYMGDQLITGLT